MSVGLSCGHLSRGVCYACAKQAAELRHAAAEANRDTFAAIAERAAAEERARIVAWLRRESPPPLAGSVPTSIESRLADAIERGEHEEGT